MKWYSSPHKQTQRHGMSLVEVIIVLGISSLLIGGAISWLSSRGGTNFYDQMRQIESVIREAESQAQTNLVSNGDIPACQNANRTDPTAVPPTPSVCPIGAGEEAFASAVGIQKNSSTSASDVIRTFYVKKKPVSSITNKVEAVEPYSFSDYSIPIDIRYTGYQYVGPTPCTTSPDIINSLPRGAVAGGSTASLVVFRKQPNAMYGFVVPASDMYSGLPKPFNLSGLLSATNTYAGDYISYGYDSPSNTLPAVPCAVVWQFQSAENITGTTTPRYTAEIIFNIANGTIKLQTR